MRISKEVNVFNSTVTLGLSLIPIILLVLRVSPLHSFDFTFVLTECGGGGREQIVVVVVSW